MDFETLISTFKIQGKLNATTKEFLFETCPFCSARQKFSFNVEKNRGQCFHSDCNKRVNLWSLHKHFKQEEKILEATSELEERCQRYEENLANSPEAWAYCTITRKWNPDVVKRERTGLNDAGTHIMFPRIYKGRVIQFKAKPMDKSNQPYQEPAGRAAVPYGVDSLCNAKQCLEVEGEPDRLSALSYGIKVVTTSGGCSSFSPDFKKFYQHVEKVYISYDMPDDEHPEENKKGQRGAYNTASLIGIKKCVNVELPMHDMNECLIYGVPRKEIQDAIRNAKHFKPVGWTNGADEDFADIKIPDPIKTGLDNIDELLNGGIRPGLYIVGAETGVGKTSISRYICYKLVSRGIKCGFMPFEFGKRYYLAKMKELAGGSLDSIRPFMETHDKSQVMYKNEHEFIQDLKNMVTMCDVKVLFIDDLKYLFSNFINPGKDIWQAQSRIMMQLQDFADECAIPVILMAPYNKAGTVKDGKELPMPSHTNVAGSADIAGSAAGVWCLQRNYAKCPTLEAPWNDPNMCRLVILKDRYDGNTGSVKLKYLKDTTKHFEVTY